MKESLPQLHPEPASAEREWTVEEIPVLSASVSLPEPVPAADRLSRRIRRYYQLQCRSFLRYCEAYLLPAAAEACRTALEASQPIPKFHAELTYRVTYNEGGLWSLYTQSRESGPGGRTVLLRRGDTWDLASGYPVALSAFFPRRSGWKRRLLDAAEAEIQQQEQAGAARYHEGIRRLLRRHFNPQNYYRRGWPSSIPCTPSPRRQRASPCSPCPMAGADRRCPPAKREAPLRPAGRAEGPLHPEDVRYFRRESGSRAALATRPLRASSASRLGNTIRALKRSERFQTSGASSMEPRATHTTAMQA